MRKRAIIQVLLTGALVFLLFRGFKNEPLIVAFSRNSLNRDTIIDLRRFSSLKKLELTIQNKGDSVARLYISPIGINTLNDSSLVNSLGLDSLNDEQKCIRLWKFIGNWTDHYHLNRLVEHNYYDPATMINGIEGGICDKRSATLANLAECAGIPGRVYKLKNHVVTELFYNNAWHMFDADKGIYYRRPDGEIADVAYLHANPQIISAATKNIEGLMPKWRNEDTRRALSPTNYVDGSYKKIAKDYSAVLRLSPGEKLCFELEPINFFNRLWRKYVGKREYPCYVRTGLRITDLRPDMLKTDAEKERIYACQMPYPIKHIKVSNKSVSGPVKVYYSSDSIHWALKGTLSHINDYVAFDAFDKDNFGFTFKYYLKFEGDFISESEELGVETEFTFSEKVLVTNPEKAFAIRFMDSAEHDLNVHLTVVE
jgi:hypothetical protein